MAVVHNVIANGQSYIKENDKNLKVIFLKFQLNKHSMVKNQYLYDFIRLPSFIKEKEDNCAAR